MRGADMAESTMHLTVFPNLYDLRDSFVKEIESGIELSWNSSEYTEDAWTIALGSIIKAYTGEPDVCLQKDDRSISIREEVIHDVGEAPGSTISPAGSDKDADRWTGVFTNSAAPSTPRLRLELILDPERNVAILRSRGAVPQDHLSHIAKQIHHILSASTAADVETQGPLEHRLSNERLSIVNSDPPKALGCDLLDLLALPTSKGSQSWFNDIAIEYAENISADDTTHISQITYRELDERVNQVCSVISTRLAASKQPLTTQPVIPVLLPQHIDLYVALLAILRSGCAFCPLQLDAPPERLRFILDDIEATLILTSRSLLQRIPRDVQIEPILLEDASGSFSKLGSTPPFRCARPSDMAYIEYTSGSTGRPKGVPNSHTAVTQSLLAHKNIVPRYSRFLQFASPTFDVSIFEIFFTFYRKATLIVCNRSEMLQDLPLILNRLAIDACELTPTVAGTLLRQRSNAPGLRLIMTIGEMLTTSVVQEFGSNETSGQHSMLLAMYGPTEAAIHCTYQTDFDHRLKPSIIGSPLSTAAAFILPYSDTTEDGEANLIALLVGHVGELAIGGHQLADGYLKRPDQTQSAFIESRRYGRIYRTGDLARLLPSGKLEVLGRIQGGQIKLRGQRIELGEIEAIASRTSGCQGAVGMVIDNQLVLFALASNPNKITRDSVINMCQQHLPAFMVPSDVLVLEQFPHLPSGKVDRKGLETFYRGSAQEVDIEQQEDDSLTQQLVRLASDTLGRSLNSQTILTANGLDSLQAIRLSSVMRKAGIDNTVSDLLSVENISELRQKLGSSRIPSRMSVDIDERLKNWCTTAVPKNVQVDLAATAADFFPCTPLQMNMLAETAKDRSAYWNTVVLSVNVPCDVQQIRTWMAQLSQKHEILRTGFLSLDDGETPYCQVLWRELEIAQISEDGHTDSKDILRPFQVSIISPGEARRISRLEQMLSWRPSSQQLQAQPDATYLVISLHHAIYDGFSIDILVTELEKSVKGISLAEQASFHDVSKYFFDLRTKEKRTENEQDLTFWRRYLHNFTPRTLPNFHGQIASSIVRQSGRGTHEHPLSISLSSLRSFSSEHAISSQSLAQAALVYVLSTYLSSSNDLNAEDTNDLDVCLATVTSGRELPITDIENIIGPCIATLPLRIDLRKARTVRDLIRMVHDSNRHLLANSATPLNEISKLANLNNGSWLSEILFVWQESLHQRSNDSESDVQVVHSEDNLEFELVVEIEPDLANDRIMAKYSYNPLRLPPRQVEILAMQIDLVMKILQDSTDKPLVDVSKLLMERALKQDQATQVALLSVENPAPSIPDLSISLVEHIRNKAKELSDVVAVSFVKGFTENSEDLEHLTYAQLDKRSDLLASHLLDSLLPVSDEELVAVIMEKSVSLYVAILAVLKTGRGYLPITPATPKERIYSIMSQAKIRICVSTADVCAALDLDQKCVKVVVESSVHDAVRADFTPPLSPRPVDEERLGYAIFTSGSTGQPKGVLVTQRNLHSNLHVLSKMYPKVDSITSKTGRLLQACSQAFDVSVFEIFYAWYTGMTLVSASNDVLFADIEHAIRKLQITHLSLTPTVAALIHPDNVPSVEFLVTAGEAVTAQVKSRWSDRGLWTGYGPSETTNICTINPRTTAKHLANNVGPPFSNTSAFVMRPGSDDILPRGAVGELCFGGDQVFRGYLDLPEVNREKIIDHPIWGRIYRSRDLGRLLTNGDILFEGRIEDGQVKIRGQRVELSEINSVLLGSDFVEDCFTVVVTSADQAAGKSLVSFWTPKSTYSQKSMDPLDLNSLQTYHTELHPQGFELKLAATIEASLPSYMQPTLLVPLPSLPRTSQGKIDRRSLSKVAEDLLSSSDLRLRFGLKLSSSTTADRNEELLMRSPEERVIATELSSLLRMAEGSVGRHDSFYSFGLDSISAISFSRRLSRNIGVFLTVSEVLRNATVASLAAVICSKPKDHKQVGDKEPGESSAIDVDRLYTDEVKAAVQLQVLGPMYPDATQRQRVVKIRPCLPIQEGLIAASLTGANKAAYCNTTTLEIAQGVDQAKLLQAWEQVVQRHEILRTCFVATDDDAYPFAQAVLESYEPQWKELQIEQSSQLEQVALRTAADVLAALTQSLPPYMFILARAPDATYLIFACHHAVYDAAGMSVLLNEVELTCRGESLPSQAPPYEPFLAEAFAAQTEDHVKFWKDHLQNFKPLTLNANSPGTFSSIQLPMNSSLSKIEEYCESNGISTLALCQVAVAKTVASLFDRTDICLGHVVSGRSIIIQHDLDYDTTKLAAPTFNTLPVRIQLAATSTSKRATNEQLLTSAHLHNLEATQHQLTSLKTITRALKIAPSGPGGGLFSVLLLLQQQASALDSNLWTLMEESGDMNFPLLIELIPQKHSDSLICRLHYDMNLIGDQAQSIVSCFQSALESCMRYPSSAFDDFSSIAQHTRSILRPHIRETSPLRTVTDNTNRITRSDDLTSSEANMPPFLAEFLRIDSKRISPSSSIFQLGIDSLSAIRLVNWLRKQKGINISLSDVLQNPRLKDLAKLVDTKHGRPSKLNDDQKTMPTNGQANTGVADEHLSGTFPCSPVQEGILAQFVSTRDLYVNAMRIKFDTPVNGSTLKARLQQLAIKHPILRTGFQVAPRSESRSTWNMNLYPPDDVQVDAAAEEDDAVELETWRKRKAQEFCDAIDRPPWCVSWTKAQGNTIQEIRIAMLHSLFDAHTLRMLLAELSEDRPTQSITSFTSAYQFVSGEAQPTDSFVLAERQTFWKKSLNEFAAGRFPNLCPLREPKSSMQTISRTFGDVEILADRCRSEAATIMATGQVAWARLLSIYTGEPTVTFGTVLSGRDAPATQNSMFPCIVTVPTSVNCSGSRLEMTRSLMDFNAKARPHQYTPLAQINGWRPTKFDTLFAYQDMRDQPVLQYHVLEECSTAEFAVSIELEITKKGQLQVRLIFRPDIVPMDQAKLLVEQYHSLLQISASDSIGNRAAIPAIDLQLMSVVHPEQETLSSPDTLLHNLLESTARRKPEKVALQFVDEINDDAISDRTWTYAQLNRLGNQVACLIQRHDVQPGSKVAICFDKCPEAFWGILGVLKSGCSYVAIDPAAPGARKEFIVKDSGAKLVLTAQRRKEIFDLGTDPSMEAEAEIAGVPLIYLDETKLEGLSGDNLNISITPDDLCYCLYTSGSTGTPKCCLITHKNAVAVMRAFSLHFENHWDEDSRWMQFASFHFDVSVLEQYWTWSEGLRVVSTPRDVIFQDLPGTLAKLEITHIDLTPSLALLVHPDEVPSLCRGVFITGGEALRQEILDAWGPHEVIYNGYGPTEATIGITMYRRVPKNGKPSNIGKCYPNAGAFVLEPDENQLVLRGGVGELCVFGELVGQGYLNRPDLNASKFPFVEELGQRIYRTGDLVRLLYDGNFDFLGRIDGQVKLRGQRLEVGEIDAVILSASEDIQDIATTVLKHAVQKKDHLVSFVCFEKTASRSAKPRIAVEDESILATVQLANSACRAKLPPYMIPSQIIPISHLPLTVNNKLDTRSLQAVYDNTSLDDLQRISNSESDSTQMTPTEQRIVSVIKLITNDDTAIINRHTSVFDLGFDSISIITLAQQLTREGVAQVRPAIILQNPVIKHLGTALSEVSQSHRTEREVLAAKQKILLFQRKHQAEAHKHLGIPRNSDAIEAVAPCTPLQSGIIARFIAGDSTAYLATFEMELGNGCDVARLHHAWTALHAECQSLRTVFVPTEDGYMQVVLRNADLPWTVQTSTDTRNAGDNMRHQFLGQESDVLEHPFQLVLCEGSEGSSLLINLCHALYDGYSLNLIFARLQKVYMGESLTRQPRYLDLLPYGPLKIASGAKSFWEKSVQAHESFIYKGNRSQRSTISAKLHSSITISPALEKARKRLGITYQSLFQACWSAALAQQLHGLVTFGIVVAGRSIGHPDANTAIGPLFNTIPFQVLIKDSDSIKDLIRVCHGFNIASQPFQHTSLSDIIRWTHSYSDRGLFDSLFVYQEHDRDQEQSNDDSLWAVHDLDDSMSDYPLAFELERQSDSLSLTLVHQVEHVAGEDASLLIEKFIRVLESLHGPINQPLQTCLGPFTTVRAVRTNNSTDGDHETSSHLTNGHSPSAEEGEILRAISTLASIPVSDIDPGQSIFELGLDSIDVLKLSSRLKKMKITVTSSQIMKSPRIQDIARMSQRKTNGRPLPTPNGNGSGSDRSRYHRLCRELWTYFTPDEGVVEAILPTTPLQEGILLGMHQSNFEQYYNHDILKLELGISIDRLYSAIGQIVARHAIFRTVFDQVDDPEIKCSFAQKVLRPSGASINWSEKHIETSGHPTDMLAQITEDARKMDRQGTLLRFTHVSHGESTFLILSMPHAMYDGWSLALFHQAIARCYDDMPREPYVSSEQSLQEIIDGQTTDAAEFWHNQVSGVAPALLPQTHRHETNQVHRHERTVSIDLQDLKLFCKTLGITLQALGQTCWSLVLAHRTRSLSAVYGVVLSGRDTEESQRVMMPTMNTIAFASVILSSSREMLQVTQETISSVRQYQNYPLAKAIASSAKNGTLFNTLFTYQINPTDSPTDLSRAPLYHSVDSRSIVEYPVCVEIEAAGDALVLRIASSAVYLNSKESLEILDDMNSVFEYITKTQEQDLFDIRGDRVQLCGLPPFNLNSAVSREKTTPLNQDDSIEISHSDTYRIIREVLSSVSATPKSHIHSNSSLYHIGLDSISAIKISALLRRRDIHLSVTDMLRAATLGQMARAVNERKTPRAAKQLENGNRSTSIGGADLMSKMLPPTSRTEQLFRSIDTRMIEAIYPASSGQIYMLAAWANTSGALFDLTFRYKISKTYQRDDIEQGWKQLITQLPILRTAFILTNQPSLPVAQCLLREVPEVVRELHIGRQHVNQGTQPLARLSTEADKEDWIITLRIHHALYDAVSISAITAQLEANIVRKVTKSPVEQLRSGPQVLFDQLAVARSTDAVRQFWTSYLSSDREFPQMPQGIGSKSAHIQKYTSAWIPDVARTRALLRQQGVGLQALFFAAYAQIYLALSRRQQNAADLSMTNSEGGDVVLGVYLANRGSEVEGASPLLPTVNLLPLRIKFSAGSNLLQTAKKVQSDLVQISQAEYSAVGLWQINEWTGVKVDTFINFLSLPEEAKDDESPDSSRSHDILQNAPRDEIEVAATNNPSKLMQDVQSSAFAASYPLSLDIEVALRNEGLDLGIFGWESMISTQDATWIENSLRQVFLDERA